MTKEELIDKYVAAHAECRWLDAGELRDLLNQFANELNRPTWKDICLIAETIFGMLGKNINDELMGRYDSPKEFYEEVLKKI